MKLSKAEKTVIFATLFCVVVMCGVGYFRLQRVDDKQYASKLPNAKEAFSKLRLKGNPLIIEAGSKVSKDPAFYYKGNKSILADINKIRCIECRFFEIRTLYDQSNLSRS